MDLIWIAFALHLTVAALIGFLVAKLGHRHLPSPWNIPSFTVALAICIGALITIATFRSWSIYPS